MCVTTSRCHYHQVLNTVIPMELKVGNSLSKFGFELGWEGENEGVEGRRGLRERVERAIEREG